MLKSFKKISVLVLVIVMTVGMAGCSTILKIANSFVESYTNEETDPIVSEGDLEYAEKLKETIKEYEERYDKAETEEDKSVIYDELMNYKEEMIWYDIFVYMVKDHNIRTLSYRYDILGEMFRIRSSMLSIERGGYQDSDDYRRYQERYDELYDYITKYDYKTYIENENKRIAENDDYSDAEKAAAIYYNDAMLSLNPTGEFESYTAKSDATEILNNVAKIRSSLESGVDLAQGGNLTPERRADIEKDLAIYEKRIDNGYIERDPDDSPGGLSFSMAAVVGNMFSVIIIILLSGSIMSHEMSTGTIKSLIIAPVKRWKIFTAKYMSIMTTIVFLCIYNYVFSFLVSIIYYGFTGFSDKIVYIGGTALQINYFLYQFILSLAGIIPLLVIATFAYMLSVLTKNTAASVSIAMGVYLGGNIVHLVLESLLNSYPYVIKFLPFSNIDIAGRIFYTGSGMSGGTVNMGLTFLAGVGEQNPSLIFSVIYIIVILICMVYSALDNFCRKDIK